MTVIEPQHPSVAPSTTVRLLLVAQVLSGDLTAAAGDLEQLAPILGRLYARHAVVIEVEPSEAAWALLCWASLGQSAGGEFLELPALGQT